MNQIEIASIKDKILLYLSKHSRNFIDIDIIYKDLQLFKISQSILNSYVEEMKNEGVVKSAFTDSGGCVMISDKGEKLLSEMIMPCYEKKQS
jgi:predicted transcriptional regulator